ncbi:MAG: cobalamin-independent methionine synthase II family protein [Rhizomicrobium sp.]
MKRNGNRIQSTHVGSLPRPDDLVQMLAERHDPATRPTLGARIAAVIDELVALQVAAGIDIVSDGEASKVGFSTYVADRYAGFGLEPTKLVFADAAETADRNRPPTAGGPRPSHYELVGPISLKDRTAIQADIVNLAHALGDKPRDQAFMTALTPGHLSLVTANRHYRSREEFMYAAADALREEYVAIVDAGFNLQLDAPDLGMCGHFGQQGHAQVDPKTYVPLAIEVLNHATRDLPPEKLRLHLCWGNYPGPHHRDVEFREIIDVVLKARPMFLSFEAANPRHAHEWEIWQTTPVPSDKVLMPGVIDTVTGIVEHPRLVAQRLETFARIVGKENVIACTDCGFSTFAGVSAVSPAVVWMKLQSMAQGARLASENLWRRE